MKCVTPMLLLLLCTACGKANNDAPSNVPAPANDASSGSRVSDRGKTKALELLAKARRELAGNGAPQAVGLLENATTHDPDNGDCWMALGEAYTRVNREIEARDAFLRAGRVDPTVKNTGEGLAARASYVVARRLYLKGQFKPAIEHLRDAMKLRPNDAAANILLGSIHHAQRDYKKALVAFTLASEVAFGPLRQEAYEWRGKAEYELGQFADAEKSFSIIIQEGYTEGEVLGWRAWCRYAQDNVEGALADFKQARKVTTNPDKRDEYDNAVRQIENAD